MRRVIAALIVVGLTIAVILLWPSPTAEIPSDTIAGAPTTTTTTSPTTTTTTVPTTTTTSTTEGSHVVETVEEAEEILRELWFGWFEGIYHQDEDRIREVVASEHQYRLALEQFGNMTFVREPRPSDISYSETEILRSSSTCTVIWTDAHFSGFVEGTSSDVHVLRWDDQWLFFSLWAFPDDLWEADCEAQLD
jgi:hypothetical protein